MSFRGTKTACLAGKYEVCENKKKQARLEISKKQIDALLVKEERKTR